MAGYIGDRAGYHAGYIGDNHCHRPRYQANPILKRFHAGKTAASYYNSTIGLDRRPYKDTANPMWQDIMRDRLETATTVL